jgi:hypothetical protein
MREVGTALHPLAQLLALGTLFGVRLVAVGQLFFGAGHAQEGGVLRVRLFRDVVFEFRLFGHEKVIEFADLIVGIF